MNKRITLLIISLFLFHAEVLFAASGGLATSVILSDQMLPEGGGGSSSGGWCADSDYDGRCNSADNCPTVSNSNQANADSDSMGDACDADDDGDGILDLNDNCRLRYNVNQIDIDGDLLGDECDDDRENDGVINSVDNCPYVHNPNQENEDGDGLGDVCDPAMGSPVTASALCTPQPGPFTFGMVDYLDVSGLSSVVSVSAGNIDGVGGLDLAAIDLSLDSVITLKLFLNKTSTPGQFEIKQLSLPGHPFNPRTIVKVANLDGVGGDDLIISYGEFDYRIGVYRNYNSGTNTFGRVDAPYKVGTTSTAATYPIAIDVADFNGDGSKDIVTVNFQTRNLSVLTNKNLGPTQDTFNGAVNLSLSSFTGLGFQNSVHRPVSLVAGNIDCDGRPDLLLSYKDQNSRDGTAAVLYNAFSATPAFTVGEVYGAEVFRNPLSLLLEDLNGDFKKDFIISNQDDQSLTILFNSNSCSTAAAHAPVTMFLAGLDGGVSGGVASNDPLGLPTRPWSLASGDLDSDGDIDLIASSGAQGIPTIAFIENDSHGNFPASANQQTLCMNQVSPYPIVSGNFNGDEKIDLVSADPGDLDPSGNRGGVTFLFNDSTIEGDGDCDNDNDVDLEDFALFSNCFTGPTGGPVTGQCLCADLDGDTNVDLDDYNMLNEIFLGPNPNYPRSLTTSAVSPPSVELSWVDQSTIEDGFVIERSDGTESRYLYASYNNQTFRDVTVVPGTTYRYTVRAYNESGQSLLSNIIDVAVPIDNGNGSYTVYLDSPREDGSVYYNGSWQKDTTRATLEMGKRADLNWIVNRSYVEWDISAMPDNAQILDVNFVYNGGYQVDCEIKRITSRPSQVGAEITYGNISSALRYYTPGIFPQNGLNSFNLGATARSDLQAKLPAGWFAIGMRSRFEGTSAGSWINSTENSAVGTKPTLVITYDPTP